MAMYNFNISSFADAERLYNNTKPIRGSKMVPLGDRRRKWERIVKVSPKCYVLLDGWDDKYKSYNWYRTEEQQIAEAAVTWTLTANNNSVVEFRNGDGDHAHCGRYSFLERCMPSSMRFIVDSGKQYVNHRGDRHFLPKDKDKTIVFTDRHTPQESWTLTSESHPLPVTRVRVNKEAKAPYKKAIEEYLHWAWTMTPMIEGTMNWDTNRDALRAADHMGGGTFRDMLVEEQHEARTDMLHAFLCQLAQGMGNRYWGHTNPTTNVSLTSDPKKFRAKFNAWVNHMGTFTRSFEEYREVK